MPGKPPPGKPFDICERTIRFALCALSAMIRRIDEAA
ncbi:MAG: hypothetical protein FD180_1500 [Planctomycetota bacterium]|nr:MAG: hypothetical protein FD180_1500 [Planctomycetota bacterium]